MNDSMDTTAGAYFFNVVTSVFDDFFRRLGACREPASNPSVVRYATDTWFAEVLYLPSDGPNYIPRIEIGCRPERFSDRRRNRVDVMYTAPEGSEEHAYNLRWRYKSRDDLRGVLMAVRDRILSVYTLPFLQDTKRLQVLLEQRRAIIETAWTQEIDQHNDSIARAAAERAFLAKDYEMAIQYYSAIPSLHFLKRRR